MQMTDLQNKFNDPTSIGIPIPNAGAPVLS